MEVSLILNHLCAGAQMFSLVWLFASPWTAAHQTPLSMGFPWQEYWSGLLRPPPGDLPVPGTEPASPALAGGFFTAEPPAKPNYMTKKASICCHLVPKSL